MNEVDTFSTWSKSRVIWGTDMFLCHEYSNQESLGIYTPFNMHVHTYSALLQVFCKLQPKSEKPYLLCDWPTSGNLFNCLLYQPSQSPLLLSQNLGFFLSSTRNSSTHLFYFTLSSMKTGITYLFHLSLSPNTHY